MNNIKWDRSSKFVKNTEVETDEEIVEISTHIPKWITAIIAGGWILTILALGGERLWTLINNML